MQPTSSQPQPDTVSRVICASLSRVQGSVMEQLFEVRNTQCSPAGMPGVRGALAYASGWFVLWIEGSHDAVEACLAKAAADARNEHQKIIHRTFGPASLDDSMTIMATQSQETPSDFAHRVMTMMQGGTRGMEPAEIFRRLSAPCIVAPRDMRAPHRHLVLVASNDHGPVDLLRRIAERKRGRVVYQRMAGPTVTSGDVGTAYVDLQVPDAVHRVQIVSRRALDLGLVRNELASADTIAVLLSERPSMAIDLASAVADCVNALPTSPEVRVISPAEEIGASVERLLHRCGVEEASVASEREYSEALVESLLARASSAPCAAH